MSERILIIEDNKDLANLLAMHLRDLTFEVDLAGDGIAGLAKSEAHPYDLIILDLMLPGLDGMEICKRLRAKPSYVPIVMLTSKSSELDRVLGLEIGADDYLTKPFSIMELLARVKAILRRIKSLGHGRDVAASDTIHAGDLTIDPIRRTVHLNGEPVDLTAREFDLLLHFAQHQGHVFTRSQLLDMVWGYEHEGYEHTVNSHINRLRAKIENNPAEPQFILTVWGVGYKFPEFDSRRVRTDSDA